MQKMAENGDVCYQGAVVGTKHIAGIRGDKK